MIDTNAEKFRCWRYDKIFSIGAQLSFLHWCRSMQYVQRKRGYWTTAILYRYLKHATFRIIWLGRMGSFS